MAHEPRPIASSHPIAALCGPASRARLTTAVTPTAAPASTVAAGAPAPRRARQDQDAGGPATALALSLSLLRTRRSSALRAPRIGSYIRSCPTSRRLHSSPFHVRAPAPGARTQLPRKRRAGHDRKPWPIAVIVRAVQALTLPWAPGYIRPILRSSAPAASRSRLSCGYAAAGAGFPRPTLAVTHRADATSRTGRAREPPRQGRPARRSRLPEHAAMTSSAKAVGSRRPDHASPARTP